MGRNRTPRRQGQGRLVAAVALCGMLWLPDSGRGGPVESGNTLALDFSTGNELLRKELREETQKHLYFFRYLHIKELEKGKTNGLPFIRMRTIEPSSDVVVDFVVQKRVSLEKAAELKTNDAVAVTGRIWSISTNRVVLRPVIVRYKDRDSPKAGEELLYEVDKDARRGTDTSSGRPVIIKR